MRIAYGVLILIDLAIRSLSFRAHYTNSGVFPMSTAFQMGLQPTDICIHLLNGSDLYQALVFLVHASAAALLLIGWRTRTMTVLCFVLAVSLQHRNFLLLNGGDNWMRTVLFWAMFLPWGDRWSIDSLKTKPNKENLVSNVASLGFILQVMAVYFVSALYKTGPAWRVDGTAIYLSLRQLEWNGDWGYYLLFFPELLKVMTFSIMLFELIGPWMLVSPILFGPLRTLAVVGFFSFHFGLEFTMELGVFPLVGMCTVVGLVPTWAWDKFRFTHLSRGLSAVFHSDRWSKKLITTSGSSQALSYRSTEPFLLMAIVFTFAWNMGGRQGENFPLPRPLKVSGQLLGLDQYWGLFAPEPGRAGGWFVIEGQLSNGTQIDLLTGQAIDWSEPRSSSIYPTQRWKRWYVVLTHDTYQPIRASYAKYLFREWADNRDPEDPKLERVVGHYIARETLPKFEDSIPTRSVMFDFERKELDL